jgi:hypothetical protein
MKLDLRAVAKDDNFIDEVLFEADDPLLFGLFDHV